jgi:DNA-binding PadR family transcriptional regulator
VSPDLKFFSDELLSLIGGHGGASAHDLRQMARSGRFLDWAGESQYYVEPKRLAKLGYLKARTAPGKTRDRIVYTLTDKGLEALREWADTPTRFVPIKSELVDRIVTADLVGEAAIRQSLVGLKEELTELAERLERAEATVDQLPHRKKYLLLAFRFVSDIFDVHMRMIEELERELSDDVGPTLGVPTGDV